MRPNKFSDGEAWLYFDHTAGHYLRLLEPSRSRQCRRLYDLRIAESWVRLRRATTMADASSIPDLYWIAARWGSWGLRVVLPEVVSLGALTTGEALDIARQILGGNAARLYALPRPPSSGPG
jgi:hypothetical protein